ncbi:hypothetical protein EDD99_7945 [Streptomyces sp. 846.5]|nr:hypothetical protein [Streptomyces sp. 846.5]TDT94037.1 hypothetical protein EDD99_7945 [Streptomyces sp. 846.5]
MLGSARSRVLTAVGTSVLASGMIVVAGGQAMAAPCVVIAPHTAISAKAPAVGAKATALKANMVTPHVGAKVHFPDELNIHFNQSEVLFFAKNTTLHVEEEDD